MDAAEHHQNTGRMEVGLGAQGRHELALMRARRPDLFGDLAVPPYPTRDSAAPAA
jgi:hypothetical protein